MSMELEIATVSAVKCFNRFSRLALEQTVCHVGYETMSDDSNSFWHISSFPSSLLEQYNGYKSVTAERHYKYFIDWLLFCGLFYDAVSNSADG
jgi:hypothetical protein